MTQLNKTQVEATTPHLLPRETVAKDLLSLGGNYEIAEGAAGQKTVTAKYLVDTDQDPNNGYVIVTATASYTKTGNSYTLVTGSEKMEAAARNIGSQSNAALDKYVKSYSGQLLKDKTTTMATAMRILLPTLEADVVSSPSVVKSNDTFNVGIEVKSNNKVDTTVTFKDSTGKTVNSNTSNIARKGSADYPFAVPAGLKAGKYTLVIQFEDIKTGDIKVQEKPITIIESIQGTVPGSFAPGQPPAIQDIKVIGTDKLEGISYVLEGFEVDKKTGEKKSIGMSKGGPYTLTEKGQLIKFDSPESKGFRKDVTYTVKFMKDNHELLAKSFIVGQASQPGPGKVKPK